MTTSGTPHPGRLGAGVCAPGDVRRDPPAAEPPTARGRIDRDGAFDAARRYLDDIGRTSLLTAAQEVDLGKRIEAGRTELRRALAAAPISVGALLERAASVRRHEARLDDLITVSDGGQASPADIRRARAALNALCRAGAEVRAAEAVRNRRRRAVVADEPRLARARARLRRIVSALPIHPVVVETLVADLQGLGEQMRALEAEMPSAVADERLRALERQIGLSRTRFRTLLARIGEQTRVVGDAKRTLIEANLRLVVLMARRHCWGGVALLDLIQEGNIGLMKAVDRYRYQRGCKFSTYAIWWIRHGIVRSIANRARLIRIPLHLGRRLNRVAVARASLGAALGREPSIDELAARLGMPVGKLESVLEIPRAPISLDMPVAPDESALGSLLEDKLATRPDAAALSTDMAAHVERALAGLSERERRVLRLRFGIGSDHAHTLDEVGEELSLTRERIRQIEIRALRKLRDRWSTRHLRSFLRAS